MYIYFKIPSSTHQLRNAGVNDALRLPLTYHSCAVVTKTAATWKVMTMQVWRKRLPRKGRASRLAGGLHECSCLLGPPRPITMASTVIRQMSRNRNSRSLMFVCSWREATAVKTRGNRQIFDVTHVKNAG